MAAGLSSPGMTSSTRLSPAMATGDEITSRLPWLPTSEKHMLAVVSDTCVVRSETDMVPLHKGGAGNVPAGAWTLMVPVLAASAPLTDVVKSMV